MANDLSIPYGYKQIKNARVLSNEGLYSMMSPGFVGIALITYPNFHLKEKIIEKL